MTRELAGSEVASHIEEAHPAAVVEWDYASVWIEPDSLLGVARFLNESQDLDFSFLTSISAVDRVDHFELVYHLLSMRRNHRTIIKLRCNGRAALSVPSVVEVWRGADLQEREIWDLMGVRFEGHPNMKRILLWDGFEGHPLRKDYLR